MGVVTAVTMLLTIFFRLLSVQLWISSFMLQRFLSDKTFNLAKALDDTWRVLKSLFLVTIISGKSRYHLFPVNLFYGRSHQF